MYLLVIPSIMLSEKIRAQTRGAITSAIRIRQLVSRPRRVILLMLQSLTKGFIYLFLLGKTVVLEKIHVIAFIGEILVMCHKKKASSLFFDKIQ